MYLIQPFPSSDVGSEVEELRSGSLPRLGAAAQRARELYEVLKVRGREDPFSGQSASDFSRNLTLFSMPGTRQGAFHIGRMVFESLQRRSIFDDITIEELFQRQISMSSPRFFEDWSDPISRRDHWLLMDEEFESLARLKIHEFQISIRDGKRNVTHRGTMQLLFSPNDYSGYHLYFTPKRTPKRLKSSESLREIQAILERHRDRNGLAQRYKVLSKAPLMEEATFLALYELLLSHCEAASAWEAEEFLGFFGARLIYENIHHLGEHTVGFLTEIPLRVATGCCAACGMLLRIEQIRSEQGLFTADREDIQGFNDLLRAEHQSKGCWLAANSADASVNPALSPDRKFPLEVTAKDIEDAGLSMLAAHVEKRNASIASLGSEL